MTEKDPFVELVEFLAPETRLDIRRAALEYVTGVSAALDGTAGQTYMKDDFRLGKALTKLCVSTVSDRGQCLAALTNFASGSPEVADHIMKSEGVVLKAWEACTQRTQWANYGARLLANLSRHFPDKVQDMVEKIDADAIKKILELISSDSKEDGSSFLGYVVVNLSTLTRVRKTLVESGCLPKVYAILRQSEDPTKREVAADVLRNLCFEDHLHSALLEKNDEFLVSLLTPLADGGDDLDDEDMQKLPLQLQYFEGRREECEIVRQRLIEALYQLCATKAGRTTLRSKGVYPLLRELDKATGEKEDPHAPPPKMKSMTLLAQEEHTLHALIGMLIRYEEDLDVDPSLESIRHLE